MFTLSLLSLMSLVLSDVLEGLFVSLKMTNSSFTRCTSKPRWAAARWTRLGSSTLPARPSGQCRASLSLSLSAFYHSPLTTPHSPLGLCRNAWNALGELPADEAKVAYILHLQAIIDVCLSLLLKLHPSSSRE